MLARLAFSTGLKSSLKPNSKVRPPISTSLGPVKRVAKIELQTRLSTAFLAHGLPIETARRIVPGGFSRLTATGRRHYANAPEEPAKVSLEQELRNHLKAFLMRVHPDFFSKHPKVQEENDRSLKQLNSLLDIVEDYAGKPSGPIQLDRNRVPMGFRATFYLRPGPKSLLEAKREEKRKEAGSEAAKNRDPLGLAGHDFEAIGASYNFPESYFSDPFPREMLERDVRLFLNDLLKQAGLPVMTVNEASQRARYDENSDEIANQFDESGGFRAKKEPDLRRQQQALRKAFKEAIQGFMDRHYPAAQIAVDKLGEDWEMHIGHKAEASIALGISELHHSTDRERKQVHYSPELNGEERAQALLLVEELWEAGTIPNDLPIYILKQPNLFLQPSALPGFLTIPLNFSMAALDKYLKDNLKTIMIVRYNLRGQLMETEAFIKQFTKSLKLARIDVRASLEHTFTVLSTINEVRTELEEKFKEIFEGMVWHIVEADALAEAVAENPNAIYVHPNAPKPTSSPPAKSEPSTPKPDSEVEAFESSHEDDSVQLEEVEGLPMLRRKLNLSQEHLAKMKEVREQLYKKRGSINDWDDDEEETSDLNLEVLSSSDLHPLHSSRPALDMAGKNSAQSANLSEKSETIEGEKQSEATEEVVDEFEAAMFKAQRDQAEKVNSEVLYTESTPLYSLARDTLLIPWNTSAEGFLSWLRANHAVWHFRQKIYPSKLWKRKLVLVAKNLKFLLGVQRVSFSDRAIWDKSIQLLAMRNLQRFAPMIKNAELNHMRVVVTHHTLSLNLRKQVLKLPYNINPAMWSRFLQQLNAERQLRQRISRSRL
jgi:hypothetical protein